ncbi:MAG TPA: choice-of-anchor Q domain-containing protein, partial [Candidatus Acidoferrales bacterium]|nr:choice-of-anchor Q domain-containing protein [Candidatus Acidoferrales bacterium]
ITNHVILDGSGVAATISGGNAVQLFYVTEGANLTISNLTLANGSATNTLTDGGAIYNAGGNVWLVGCTLTNNLAQSSAVNGLSRGGALFNNGGVASLYQCVITGNSAIGGGVELLQGLGGAIYNTNGSVAIIGCELNGNSASDLVGAEISFDEGGWGQALGGAVFQASGIMAITNSSFVSNQAVGPDGGRQSDAFSAYGGALAAAGGTLFVDDSQFMTNQAVGGSDTYGWGATAGGGAVYCAGNATIAECTFGGNQTIGGSGEAATSVAGGGIYNDTAGVLALNRCAIYANVAEGGFATINIIPLEIAAGFGGGVFNAGQFAATNCTVAFNSAIGGENLTTPLVGTTGNALGGGLYNNSGAAIVAMNLTIADNVCLSPAGQAYGFYFTNGLAAGAQIANTNGTFHLHNSILAYGTNSNAYGPITDDGYNICSDGSAGLDSGSSFNNTDPLLAPLGSYGGPTWCMALLPNSPAIGGADPSDFPATDQRGYPRPAGSGPDIGAYEYGASPGAPMLTLGTSGNSVVVSFTAFPANLYRLQWSTNLVAWNDLSTNGPVYGPTMINQSVSKQVHSQCFFRLIMQ